MRHVSEDLGDEVGIDFILLSINTPLDPTTNALSMKYLWSSVGNVSALLARNSAALVVVRSTVTLGFTAAYRAALQQRLGHAVRICFQPEFLRAKSALHDATHPWHVVVGSDAGTNVDDYVAFQSSFIDRTRISRCTVDEAEVMKIFHNSFNAAKISYFNHAAMLIDAINARDHKHINPANTFALISRTCEGLLNPMYGLTPGHAYYGSCLPKDSAELASMEKAAGLKCNLFTQVVEVNNVVKASDKEAVLHGDNHVDSGFFHAATAPVTAKSAPAKHSMCSLADADKLTDSSDSS